MNQKRATSQGTLTTIVRVNVWRQEKQLEKHSQANHQDQSPSVQKMQKKVFRSFEKLENKLNAQHRLKNQPSEMNGMCVSGQTN